MGISGGVAMSSIGAAVGAPADPPGMIIGSVIGAGIGYFLGRGATNKALELASSPDVGRNALKCDSCGHCFQITTS